MKSLFLFEAGDSFLHRADPRSKLLAILILLWFALTTINIYYMALLLSTLIVSLWRLAGISPRDYLPVIWAFLPLVLLVAAVQGVVRPEPYVFEVGPLHVSGVGLVVGSAIGLRLVAMALSFLAFAMTTNPTDIALAVTKLRIPFRYSYLTSFGLRFLPLIQEEAATLLTAMEVRSSPDPASKNPVKRIRAIVRMLLPLMVGSLRRSIDIALAMELRGYRSGKPRTYLRRIGFKREDAWLLVGVGTFAVVSLYLQFSGLFEFGTYKAGA